MCTLKGTTDGNWGDICVLAVSDLYQLPPVGQCPIYMSPQIVHTLNDTAPNGWEKMQLHELTQSMRQKDMKFINCLNKIHTTVPLEGSEEDRMLQSHELKLNPNHENYPHDAMHVYAQKLHCDEWNENTKTASWKRIHKYSNRQQKRLLHSTCKCDNAYQSM